MDIVTTFAAAVQAVSAVAIVLLTVKLASVANAASKASADSAKATDASYREMRRQGQLAALPLIDVRRPRPFASPEAILIETLILLENVSGHAAVDVRVSLLPLDDQRKPKGPSALSIPLPVLAAQTQTERVLPSNEIRALTRTVDPKVLAGRSALGDVEAPENSYAEFGPYYASDWLLVRVECRSMLGSRITQEYEWNGNADHQDAFGVWSLRVVQIQPDPDRPEDVVELHST